MCVYIAVCIANEAVGVEWPMMPANSVALADCPQSLAGILIIII